MSASPVPDRRTAAHPSMPPHAIVSYDDSPLDRDALALGALLRDAGATLTLGYVRHAPEDRADRELIADVGAEGVLREGAARLGQPDVARRIVMHPSTAGGLAALADELLADLIVFGSEYRTPHGRIGLGRSATTLAEDGPAALALAPVGFAAAGGRELRRIGVLPQSADEAAIETAHSLAAVHDATVIDVCAAADLMIVGSRAQARPGRAMVSASAVAAIEEARVPVLVTARDVPLDFQTLVAA